MGYSFLISGHWLWADVRNLDKNDTSMTSSTTTTPLIHCLPDLLRYRSLETPGAVAIIEDTRAWNYAEVASEVGSLVVELCRWGVKRGDRVAVYLPKSAEEIFALFAIAELGAVVVFISGHVSVLQLEHIIHDAKPKVLITGGKRLRPFLQLKLDYVPIFLINGPLDVTQLPLGVEGHGWQRGEGTLPDGRVIPVDRDLAALHYTSGSTGLPKGVMVSHLNYMDATRRICGYLGNTEKDRVLGYLPMSAPWGVLQLTTMFLVGGSIVLHEIPLPSEMVRVMQKYEVTGLAAMPPTWISLTDYMLSSEATIPSLRYITSSGGKIPVPTLKSMPRSFPDVQIHLTYGLTEAFRSTWLPPEQFENKAGSLGKATPNVDVFILDEAGHICGPGEQGELIHRGSLVTQGYWNRPNETARNYRPCPALQHLIGNEIVHYSGDQVRIDEEGYLWFIGRMDHMAKCHGFRVSLEEVEHLLTDHPLISHAVAFTREDDVAGNLIEAIIEGSPDLLIEGKLADFCRQRFAKYMKPICLWVFPGEMPMTHTGKINRKMVSLQHTKNPNGFTKINL